MSGFLLTTARPALTGALSPETRAHEAAAERSSDALLRLPGLLHRAIARYFTRRDAIADLNEADEHALQDIGIARSEIEAAVHGLIRSPSGKRA